MNEQASKCSCQVFRFWDFQIWSMQKHKIIKVQNHKDVKI